MKHQEETLAQVRQRYALVRDELDERGRRQVVAAEALAITVCHYPPSTS